MLLWSYYRVLNSLEQFALAVEIAPHENNITQFTLQSFGGAIVNVFADEFQGQTVSLVKERGTSNITSNDHTEWRMMIANGLENDSAKKDFVATMLLPQQLLSECVSTEVGVKRVAYFVFFTGALFWSKKQQQIIGSQVITAAILNCSVNKLTTPIILTHIDNTSDEVIRSAGDIYYNHDNLLCPYVNCLHYPLSLPMWESMLRHSYYICRAELRHSCCLT